MVQIIGYAFILAMFGCFGVVVYRLGVHDARHPHRGALNRKGEPFGRVFSKQAKERQKAWTIRQKEIANFYNYDGSEMPNPKEGD
jgi:hypothetical protein